MFKLARRLSWCCPSHSTVDNFTVDSSTRMNVPSLMKIEAMRVRVAAYLTNEGFGEWSMGGNFDSRVSTSIPVMSCIISLKGCGLDVSNNKLATVPSAIGIQEGWVLIGGVEYGNHDLQSLIWLCDSTGKKYNIVEVSDENGIDAYLRKHLPTEEVMDSLRQTTILNQQAEERISRAVKESVCEQDIDELVHKVMTTGIAHLGPQTTSAMRQRFATQMEGLLMRSIREYSFLSLTNDSGSKHMDSKLDE